MLECMWFGCHLPIAVVSQEYPGNAEICPGFPPLQAALHIILSNEGDAVYTEIELESKPMLILILLHLLKI